jgi:hypothetical protein
MRLLLLKQTIANLSYTKELGYFSLFYLMQKQFSKECAQVMRAFF